MATAAASHLYDGHARARALGVVGALTFLGMAAGPFVGRVDHAGDPPGRRARRARDRRALRDALAAPWRYVFYLNVPIGIATLALGWAAMAGWATPRRESRLDLPGAVAASIGLAALLLGDHARRQRARSTGSPIDPALVAPALVRRRGRSRWRPPCSLGRRGPQPFVDAALVPVAARSRPRPSSRS